MKYVRLSTLRRSNLAKFRKLSPKKQEFVEHELIMRQARHYDYYKRDMPKRMTETYAKRFIDEARQ